MRNGDVIVGFDPLISFVDGDDFFLFVIPVEVEVSLKPGLNVTTQPLLAHHFVGLEQRVLVVMPDPQFLLEKAQVVIAQAPQDQQVGLGVVQD